VYYTDLRDHDAEPSDHNTTGEDEQRDDRYASTSSQRRQRASSSSHKQRRKSLSREGSSSFREEPLQTRISSQTSRANKVNKSAHRRPHGKSAIKTKADKTKATADKYSICEEKTAASSKPKNRGEESSDTLSYGWASDYSKFRKMLQEKDGKPPGEEQQLSTMAKLLPKEQREDTQPKKSKNGKQTSTSKSKHSNTVVDSKPKQVSVVSESTPNQAAVSSTSKSKPELASVVSESKSKRTRERSSSTSQPIQTIPNPKTLVSRESSQETYMDELRAKLESCVTQREEPIESLMASRRAIQVEERQVVEPMELAPPPKYSLSQVKQATVSPSSQDAFMKELKAWHAKYSLRKVPREEKQRPKQASELQSTKFESAQDVQARPVEEKRAHAKSKKWGKFSMLFKRKQRLKQQKEGCFNVEEMSDKIAEKEPTTAPQSLVEQRKKELESFFVAYTQTIHKDKAAASSPTSSPAEQGNKESDYDETEEGTEVELFKGGSDVSQGVSSLTIPVPSAVVLTVASKGKNENVSGLSSKENDQVSSSGSGSVYSSLVDSRKENRNEQRGHDGHNKATPTFGVTWKDIQPNKVVVVTKRQRSTPPVTPTITNDSTIKQREVAWEGGTTKQRPTTTNKPRGDNRTSKDKSDALRTSSKSKQNINNTKSRRRRSSSNNTNGKSNTTATSSTRKPSSAPRGASLFGNNNGRCTMTEAERRWRERKARLSQTLF
jgi:hypothetical protein